MSENELDAQEIAAYRKVLDFARDVLGGKVPPHRAIKAGDALFAALARRDDEVARLRAENTALRDIARTFYWCYGAGKSHQCGVCLAIKERGEEHGEDCPVGQYEALLAQEVSR